MLARRAKGAVHRMKRISLVLFLLFATVPFATASDPEYTQFGHDIRIGPDQEAGEVTCIGCSIYISGQVSGDVTAIAGNVVMEGEGSVAGDLTTVLGDIRLNDTSKVGGDLAAVGGALRRQPGATVGGDVTALEGRAWVWLIVGPPVLFLAGLIWLVVWLLERRRRPQPAPLVRAA
jgi:hypothetical protein